MSFQDDDILKKYQAIKSRYFNRFDASDKKEETEEQEEEASKPKKSGGGGHSATSLPYGIAKGAGLDTTGMTPHEVWQMLEGKGYSASAAYSALKSGKKGSAVGNAAKSEKASSPATDKKPSKSKANNEETKAEEKKAESQKASESKPDEHKKGSNKPYKISSDYLSKKDVHFMEPGTKIQYGDDEITKGEPQDGKSMWTVKHPDGSIEEWTGGKLQHIMEKTPKDIDISLPDDSKKGKYNLNKHFPGKLAKEKLLKEVQSLKEKEDGTLHTDKGEDLANAELWDSLPEGTEFELSSKFGKVINVTKNADNTWQVGGSGYKYNGKNIANSLSNTASTCDIKIPDKAVKNEPEPDAGGKTSKPNPFVKPSPETTGQSNQQNTSTAGSGISVSQEQAQELFNKKDEIFAHAFDKVETAAQSGVGDVKKLIESYVTCNSPEEADDILRSGCGLVWNSLSQPQKDALYSYTQAGGSYRPINKALGTKNKSSISYYKGEINAITEAIDKSVLPEDMTLFSGYKSSVFCTTFGLDSNKFSSIDPKDLIGMTGNNLAFRSCGDSVGKGWSGKVHMTVSCPKGTKAIYAAPWSACDHGSGKNWDGKSTQDIFTESEVILQRGTQMMITDAKWDGGTLKIKCVVTGQKYEKL